MNKWFKISLFILIIFIAGVLRTWKLGEIPPSPDWDEVALGYNAYSILQTGRDEYGEFLPIVLRSFDDYKPALYAYFIIPFIKLLGLNVVAVRLPSAAFGILTVFATYFLLKELFKNSDFKLEIRNWKGRTALFSQALKLDIPTIATAMLAISPWHVQFSRIAFEANVGLALNVFTVLFFLKGLKNPKLLLLSFFLGALNIHMYQSNRVFTPLLLIALSVIFRKELLKNIKYYVFGLLIAIVAAMPFIVYVLTNQDALLRAKGVSIFSNQTEFLKRNTQKLLEDNKNGDALGMILDNRRFEYAKEIINGYISHYSLNWLFITGDLARHHAPNMGLLYLFELPFLLIGIYSLVFGKFDIKIKFTIFSIFLLAPIPASITSGVPHAVRTLNFLPTFQIFVAIGLITSFSFLQQMKKNYLKFLILIFNFSLLTFNFVYYLNQYFVQYNYENSADWQYGYKEAISEIEKIESRYKKIIVSNEPHLDQSYMFFLFYLAYPPSVYQLEAKNVAGGFAENHLFGKFEFRPIDWDKEIKDLSVLYVGRPHDFSVGAKVVKPIYFLNREEAIIIVEG